ncbi:hypothetical protein [Humibacillus xanthopallidus]|uniref:Uncharacterized protein n=1 Tax=Humibacillus xanthopallidus TaxID=412689 RepID=A0A543HGA2_9MICO|nr:hypothetical protein [Humibacillus xanthopallidus]TQM57361.1 hypothetical protein FBY41_4185 [Humibacillus xanthopallidus]
MSTPPAAVTRSTVVAASDPGRIALALVLHRLALRHWVDLLVPATLVLALEWLLGLPLVVGLLLAVATVAVLVTVRIWQARRRFARSFPVDSRLTVTASPSGLVLTRGDDPPAFDVRWHLFDTATVVRDHLVLGMRGSQALVVLPASLSDEGLVSTVKAAVAGAPLVATAPDGGEVSTASEASPQADSPIDAGPVDPARVTTTTIDEATIDRMSRDFTVQSVTGLRTLALLGLLVALSVLVQFSSDATTRWVLPVVTVVFIVAVVVGGYLGTRRVLRRSPGGLITLTFGDEGFTATSDAGTSRMEYRDILGVTVRGETVMIRGAGGAVAVYPLTLFPPPLLAEVRAGAARR